MYYKVLKNNKVIDVLDKLTCFKYLPKRGTMTLCNIDEAQAILSSDGETIWHEKTLQKIPVDGYDTVELVVVDEYEYKKLKMLNLKTPEEIVDEVMIYLLENNII